MPKAKSRWRRQEILKNLLITLFSTCRMSNQSVGVPQMAAGELQLIGFDPGHHFAVPIVYGGCK